MSEIVANDSRIKELIDMEFFSLSGASGWNRLSTLLAADPTFSGIYMWTVLIFHNTHASATMIIKPQTSVPAGGDASGWNLTAIGGASSSVAIDAGNQGFIDGKNIWVKCSGAATTFDVGFVRKSGAA